ncbi:hypothetical protein AMAG_18695 [Allomyces macrogynus ATCC 38327]|uniref:AB hydrolase-1 domain-containing protein n=1 Tax=Allomyces macrogynus (strain ATCC 38327) TaxID=578462 RepID=A0A0L0SEK6_ALLM3|nr:hypothetical protein AMAG_18695 [Allomyces macrogynus ATCC 38327]|eukprot:KNE60825.1 hypothetical protein AMAG_18695 [Allomyces macrogynus ATCC 38327]
MLENPYVNVDPVARALLAQQHVVVYPSAVPGQGIAEVLDLGRRATRHVPVELPLPFTASSRPRPQLPSTRATGFRRRSLFWTWAEDALLWSIRRVLQVALEQLKTDLHDWRRLIGSDVSADRERLDVTIVDGSADEESIAEQLEALGIGKGKGKGSGEGEGTGEGEGKGSGSGTGVSGEGGSTGAARTSAEALSLEEIITNAKGDAQATASVTIRTSAPATGEITEAIQVAKEIQQVRQLIESTQRKQKERVWLKNQSTGELDDRKLVEARVSVVPLASLVARAAPTTTTTTAVHAPRRAIIVLHGIFGSKQNWTSLTKAMARATATDIYALDLRNHGDSPHHPEMTYEAMARDVAHFVEREDLDRPLVVGHSMGGKVAMQLALEHADKIAGFMSLDMSPLTFDLSRAVFPLYLSAMQLVQKANVEKMSQADKILKEYIPGSTTREVVIAALKKHGIPIATQDGYQIQLAVMHPLPAPAVQHEWVAAGPTVEARVERKPPALRGGWDLKLSPAQTLTKLEGRNNVFSEKLFSVHLPMETTVLSVAAFDHVVYLVATNPIQLIVLDTQAWSVATVSLHEYFPLQRGFPALHVVAVARDQLIVVNVDDGTVLVVKEWKIFSMSVTLIKGRATMAAL